jgi:hypothetical protein
MIKSKEESKERLFKWEGNWIIRVEFCNNEEDNLPGDMKPFEEWSLKGSMNDRVYSVPKH